MRLDLNNFCIKLGNTIICLSPQDNNLTVAPVVKLNVNKYTNKMSN